MTEPSNTVNAITSFNLEYTTIKLPSKVRRLSSLSQDAQDCLCEDKVVDEQYQFPGNWDTGPEELAMFFKPIIPNTTGYNYFINGSLYYWYLYSGYNFYYGSTPYGNTNSSAGWFKDTSSMFSFTKDTFTGMEVASSVKIVLNKTANVFEEYSDIPSLYFYSTSSIKHYGVKKEIQRKCWAGRGTLGSDQVIVIISPFGGLYSTTANSCTYLNVAGGTYGCSDFDGTSSRYSYIICYLNSKSGIFPPGDLCESPYCVVSSNIMGGQYQDAFGDNYPTYVNEGFYWNNSSNSAFFSPRVNPHSSYVLRSIYNPINLGTSFSKYMYGVGYTGNYLYGAFGTTFTSPLTVNALGNISSYDAVSSYNFSWGTSGKIVIAGTEYLNMGNYLLENNPLYSQPAHINFSLRNSSLYVDYTNNRTLYGNQCVSGRPVLVEQEKIDGEGIGGVIRPTGHPLTGSITSGSVLTEYFWSSVEQPVSVIFPPGGVIGAGSPCTYPYITPPQPNFPTLELTPFNTGITCTYAGLCYSLTPSIYDHVGKHVWSVNGDGTEYYSVITEEKSLEHAGKEATYASLYILQNPNNPTHCGWPGGYYSAYYSNRYRVGLNVIVKAKLWKIEWFNPPFSFPQQEQVVDDLDTDLRRQERASGLQKLFWHPVIVTDYEEVTPDSNATASFKVAGTGEIIRVAFTSYNYFNVYGNTTGGGYCGFNQYGYNYSWQPGLTSQITMSRKIKIKCLYSQFSLEGLIPNGGFKYPATLTDAKVRVYPVPTVVIPPPPAIPGYPTVGVSTVSEYDPDDFSESTFPQYFYLASDFSKLVAYKFPNKIYTNMYYTSPYGYSNMYWWNAPLGFLNVKEATKFSEFQLYPSTSSTELYTSVIQQTEANQALYKLSDLSKSIRYMPSILSYIFGYNGLLYGDWTTGFYNTYIWNSITSDIAAYKPLKDFFYAASTKSGYTPTGILFDETVGPVQTFLTDPYTVAVTAGLYDFTANKEALSWISTLYPVDHNNDYLPLDNSVYLQAANYAKMNRDMRPRSEACGRWNTGGGGYYSNSSRIGWAYPTEIVGTRGLHDTWQIETHPQGECGDNTGPSMIAGTVSGHGGFIKHGITYSQKTPLEYSTHVTSIVQNDISAFWAKYIATDPKIVHYYDSSYHWNAGYGYWQYDNWVNEHNVFPTYTLPVNDYYGNSITSTCPVSPRGSIAYVFPSGNTPGVSYNTVNGYASTSHTLIPLPIRASFVSDKCIILNIQLRQNYNDYLFQSSGITKVLGSMSVSGTYYKPGNPYLKQKFLCSSVAGISKETVSADHPKSLGYLSGNITYTFGGVSDFGLSYGTQTAEFYNVAQLHSNCSFIAPRGTIIPGKITTPGDDPNWPGDGGDWVYGGSYHNPSDIISDTTIYPQTFINLRVIGAPYSYRNTYGTMTTGYAGIPGAPYSCTPIGTNPYYTYVNACLDTDSVSTLSTSCYPWSSWQGCNYFTHYDGTKIYENEYNCESNIFACPNGHSKEFIHDWFNPPVVEPLDYTIRFGYEHTGYI